MITTNSPAVCTLLETCTPYSTSRQTDKFGSDCEDWSLLWHRHCAVSKKGADTAQEPTASTSADRSYETSVPFQQTIRRHIPDDRFCSLSTWTKFRHPLLSQQSDLHLQVTVLWHASSCCTSCFLNIWWCRQVVCGHLIKHFISGDKFCNDVCGSDINYLLHGAESFLRS